ncbi:MAG: carbon starvation protein A [Nitrospiraceae bacterium]|nr:carbon starvation protein A [Nitrospiraceae bacterium]
MLALLFAIAVAAYVAAYFIYGRYMTRVYDLDNAHKTPAQEMNDGLDYCPTHPAVLLGHHFASIAGAGPIVGPIAAAGVFGWLPVYIWCVLGSIFIGGPHDMAAVVSSIRHQGRSIGEVVDHWIGHRAKQLFLSFTWLTLVLIIAVFLQLAASTLAKTPAVAFANTVYVLLALVFGVLVYRLRLPLLFMTIIAVPIVFGAVWYGNSAAWVQSVFALTAGQWRFILIGYVFVASILPVWFLLQPRDYLASYLLYAALIVGTVGMLFGATRYEVVLPAFVAFSPKEAMYLWPLLCVMVACGAISGFHCLVGSGTTSKQLKQESHAVFIGYGSMLIEGIVAIIALGTIMVVGVSSEANPLEVFGAGFGKFAVLVGLDETVGAMLGLLAINSFILTTLDTATRLGRYQLQELSNMKLDRFSATILSVGAALVLLFVKTGDVPAWKVIWPVFGASNQLVAALALLTMVVWITKGLKKNAAFLKYPMYFMVATTLTALVLLIRGNIVSTPGAPANYPIVGVAALLFVLAVMLIVEAYRALKSSARVE